MAFTRPKYYIDLVKSQLSKYEILLLAYDCIWIQDKTRGENFMELAKYNNILSALEAGELIESVSEVKHIDILKNRYAIIFGGPVEFTN
jgi:Putative phage abortive infection protein